MTAAVKMDSGADLRNLSREKYDAIDAANFSTLKLFAKSPAHYRHGLTVPREDTDAMRKGRCAHLAILEPARFASEVVVWREGARRGKAWEAFKAANVGREILTEDEHAECVGMAASVRANEDAIRYLGAGRAEVSAVWTDEPTGIRCKGRLDWLATASPALVDLKTTRDASPEKFRRTAWESLYHAQAAFYSDAVFAYARERLPFVVVGVENTAPFVCGVYPLAERLVDAGRLTYRNWLRRLAECRRTNRWPGYVDGPVELDAPQWADASGEVADDDTPNEEA